MPFGESASDVVLGPQRGITRPAPLPSFGQIPPKM
jgi:hypothetical protein